MLIGILGINHKLADLKLREILAKTCERRFGAGKSLHNDHAFVLLSTCNRTEIYFHSKDLASTHTYIMSILRQEVGIEFDQKLYSYFGFDCFLHLARVTAGLDSAILIETEIQGQVKKAYENVLNYHTLPKELHFLFQKVLKIGKKVRSHLPIQRGLPNFEQVIFTTGDQLFKETKPSILFVGVSDINCRILHYFKLKHWSNITICNRSLTPAKNIAERYSTAILPWENIHHWHRYDWVIVGTKAPHYLITSTTDRMNTKLIMDFSLPRNVDPELDQEGMILMNIDEMHERVGQRMQKMSHILFQTEEMLSQETKQHFISFKQKEQYPTKLLITA